MGTGGSRGLIRSYTIFLDAEGRSPKTVSWHHYNLGKFAAWLEDHDHPQDPDEWTPTLLREFFVHEKHRPSKRDGKPLSPHSVKTLGSSVRCFCNWLRSEGLLSTDLFAKVGIPKAPKLVKPVLSPEEVKRVLDAARDGRQPHRDEAILFFLLDTGARANEVCLLRHPDVDWDQRIAKLRGKGAKERYVPVSSQTARAMQRYDLRERKGTTDRFFENELGWPLTPSGVLALCKRVGKRANVDLNPHKFRHTFSITYLRSGGSVFALQKTLGHTSLDTTLRYAALVTDDLVNEHAEHSPVQAMVGGRLAGRKHR